MEKSATQWAMEPLRKYARLSGRASRSEYWWYTLAIIIGSIVLAVVDGALFGSAFGGVGLFGGIFALATFVPSLAVSFRRMHDVNRSAWWLLIGLIPLIGTIVVLVWFCSRGTAGENRFGPDPLDPSGDVAEVFA